MDSVPVNDVGGSSRSSASVLGDRENLEKIVCENEYHVEEWYPLVADLTFPTLFLDFSLEEAKNFLNFLNLSIKDPTAPGGRKFICNKQRETELKKGMQMLQQKIEKGMKEISGDSGSFVRLSTRSPKDAATSKIYDIFLSEKKSLIQNQSEDNDLTQKIIEKIAFTRANVRVLCVKTGEEAVELMTNSNRVREDVQALVKISATKNMENSHILTKIVIRKWVEILPEFEFRCFVYDKKITAITQYYKTTYVPQMVQIKEALQDRMISYFEKKVNPRIPVSNYVLDLAVLPTPEPGSDGIWVVEINNPPPVAGQALFDWFKDDDRKIIEGKSPFEFRILSEAPKNPMSDAQGFIDAEKEKREKEKAPKKHARKTSY